MRGELDESTLRAIAAALPDISALQGMVRDWQPTSVGRICLLTDRVDSKLPTAAVALNDAMWAVTEARYALHEARAHLVWYREKSPGKPNEAATAFSSGFYSVCVTLCLYTAAERLADAIIAMLSIDRSQLPKETKPASLQSRLGKYLWARMPDAAIAGAVRTLWMSAEWQHSIRLRNEWVHGQRPLIAGLGIQYKQRGMWIQPVQSGGMEGHAVFFGGGDKPDFEIEELVNLVARALEVFVGLFSSVAEVFGRLLSRYVSEASSSTLSEAR